MTGLAEEYFEVLIAHQMSDFAIFSVLICPPRTSNSVPPECKNVAV